jgi:hypothetical protein
MIGQKTELPAHARIRDQTGRWTQKALVPHLASFHLPIRRARVIKLPCLHLYPLTHLYPFIHTSSVIAASCVTQLACTNPLRPCTSSMCHLSPCEDQSFASTCILMSITQLLTRFFVFTLVADRLLCIFSAERIDPTRLPVTLSPDTRIRR